MATREPCPAELPLCPLSGIRGCTHQHPRPRRWFRRKPR